MNNYYVYDKASGEVVFSYFYDSVINTEAYPLEQFDHVPHSAYPKPLKTPVYGGRRELTIREFRDLFTEEEKNAIDELEARLESLAIPEDIRKRIRSGFADYHACKDIINLDDPRVPMLLGVFVGFDCIAYERIEEVVYG